MSETKSKITAKAADIEARLLANRTQEVLRPAMLVDSAAGFANKAIDLRIIELPPGSHSKNHRETREHIMYILKGKGHSIINGEKHEWQEGDAVFVPTWAWHQFWNTDPERYARYLVATNLPMVRSLGLDRTEWAKE